MKKKIINSLAIIFFIITGMNILFPDRAYDFYMFSSRNLAQEGLFISDNTYLLCIILFIIIIIDTIVCLWKNVKLKEMRINLIVIGIFVFLNIFSSPIGYITKNNSIDYRLDPFLTCINISSNEGDYVGGQYVGKYIYFPIIKKIIIFNDYKIELVTFNDNNYRINYDYHDES